MSCLVNFQINISVKLFINQLGKRYLHKIQVELKTTETIDRLQMVCNK